MWAAGVACAQLTADGMRRSSMRLVNVLGQNDDPPDDVALAALLNESTVAACLYYAWGAPARVPLLCAHDAVAMPRRAAAGLDVRWRDVALTWARR